MENKTSAILEGLNSEQKSAVSCVVGPVLIVAGAGSGKTRVLTSRIAYILEEDCPPERVLALTFTKKAASEMKERIALMVGNRKARAICMGTFHSVFIRFLREFSESLGYPESFTIYDTSDSISAIKACLKELQLDDKVYKPKSVLSRISSAKNSLVTASAYSRNDLAMKNDAQRKMPRINEIYLLYDKKCRQAGVMDFDDILLNMNILLRDNKQALDSISGRFDYIMVDEYQDTNLSQYYILKKLAQRHRNLCVVGDDSQSIYAFRGARIENILNFKKDYPDNRTFRLEQNYRSTQIIVDSANSLIERNSARIPKNCFSQGDTGEKIKLIKAYTEQEEALLIASEIISRIQSDKAQYKDFAILYRTNSQSRSLEEALRKRNLPYMIYSGNSFFDRAEVKDMMAYFKLIVNVNDDESFKRIVNKPARGIGDTSISALVATALDNQCSLFKAASMTDSLTAHGLKPAALNKIQAFCNMINTHAIRALSEDAHKLAVSIAQDSGLYLLYKLDSSIEGQSKASNIEELLNSVANYIEERHHEYLEDLQADGTLTGDMDIPADQMPVVLLCDFLENVSLLSAVDIEGDDSDNKIALMTVHSSKGLEFPYVFVAGLEENLFPSGGFLSNEAEIEEERRLCYVAMTRAKKVLQLSFASTRMRNGKHESNAPSRFIKEIDARYILNPLMSDEFASDDSSSFGSKGGWANNFSRYASSGPVRVEKRGVPVIKKSSSPKPITRPHAVAKGTDENFIPSPIMDLRVGQRVEHNRFGFGTILELSGNQTDLKAVIDFDTSKEKTLLLKYAKIRIV